MISHFKGNKKPQLQKLYQDFLKILEAVGIPTNDLSDRAKEKMVGACLAIGNAKKSLSELISRQVSDAQKTRDIINYENKYFAEKISLGSYDDIRRKDLLAPKEANVVMSSASFEDQATNSPNRGYILNPLFVHLAKQYGKPTWEAALKDFMEKNALLKEKLARKRELSKIPVTLPNGIVLKLSVGEHNELHKKIIEELLPRFGFGAEVLYIGDTEKKLLYVENEKLKNLHFFTLGHEELPDIVAYSEEKNILYMIEAVHSFGPMSEIRINKIKRALEATNAKTELAFFTAFLDKKTFRKWCESIAWETEVWIADNPDHLIHFNGYKFLELHK